MIDQNREQYLHKLNKMIEQRLSRNKQPILQTLQRSETVQRLIQRKYGEDETKGAQCVKVLGIDNDFLDMTSPEKLRFKPIPNVAD